MFWFISLGTCLFFFKLMTMHCVSNFTSYHKWTSDNVHRYLPLWIVCLSHRYTIVMIYYTFSLLFLMCARPLISMKFVECKGTKSIYAALYFLPILIVIQAVLGGLLCKYNFHSFSFVRTVSWINLKVSILSSESNTLKVFLWPLPS